ncbi:MAG: gene transfer agent family protein [Alphaproteobacteria bacterium]|nr:gene transfer agent family protein [Alphaproteobacteria bacterium]
MSAANPVRGEAGLDLAGRSLLIRPSFAALVAAEAELGPLFALCERAAAGQLTLAEMAALLWHCCPEPGCGRPEFAEALVAGGLARATPALRTLLGQILAGAG